MSYLISTWPLSSPGFACALLPPVRVSDLSIERIMRHPFPILLAIAHLLSVSSGQITCYRPNGDSSTHNDTKICSSVNGAVSMCCNVDDECLPNGICKVPATSGESGSEPIYWRDTCSQSSWPEVGCLKVCAVCLSHHRGSDCRWTDNKLDTRLTPRIVF